MTDDDPNDYPNDDLLKKMMTLDDDRINDPDDRNDDRNDDPNYDLLKNVDR